MRGGFRVCFLPLKHDPDTTHERKDDSLNILHENITKELRLYQAVQDPAFAIKILHILEGVDPNPSLNHGIV